MFTGAIGGGDTQDGVTFQNMTIGQEYTVTVTVDDISDTTALTLINSANFPSINYYITDGVAVSPQADTGRIRDFVTTSPKSINGNTFSFNFTSLQHSSLSFQVMGDGAAESYSITFAEAVVVALITDFTSGVDKIDLQAVGINAIEDLSLTDVNGNAVIDLGEGRTAASLDSDDFILVDTVFNGDLINDKENGKSGVDFMYGNEGNDQLDG